VSRNLLAVVALLGGLAVVALANASDPADPRPAGGAKLTAEAPSPEYVLHTLPNRLPFGGFTLGRHVFLKTLQQTPYSLGHELVHVRQQAEQPVWFWVSYLALPHWRLRWEAEAYAVQARATCPIDGERGLAAYLSGRAYLWAGTREEAAAEIRKYL
jgi:hypothetical protein